MNTSIQIVVDDLTGSPIIQLLEEHLADMHSSTPAESVHALDLEELKAPNITFWSAWQDKELLGCGALKELNGGKRGEIKSMRTVRAHLRKGVASSLLNHIIVEAKQRSYNQLLLETGSQREFASARALYTRAGFEECPPFETYTEDPNSVFMMLKI